MERVALNAHRLRSGSAVSTVKHALDVGIRTIDVLGSQERSSLAVSEALKDSSEKVRVMSKIGYFDASADGDFLGEGRKLSDNLGYSMAPSFVEAEAMRLVEKFGRVDALLHHPELSDNFRPALDRLFEMRSAGANIGKIGIATNDPKKMLAAGNSVIEVARFPTSPLEPFPFDESVTFETIGCRPLLHVDGKKERRFIDHDVSPSVQEEYVDASQKVLMHFTPPSDLEDEETREGCAWILQLIGDLNSNISEFTSIEMWDREIASQIVPLLHEKFSQLDEDSAELLYAFFKAYGQIVRWNATQTTRRLCNSIKPDEPLADWALRAVLSANPPLSLLSIAFQSPKDIDLTKSAIM